MAHTRGTRLGVAAFHPGAILVNYLGYPGTIGTKKYAEYIIVDQHIVVPETAVEEVSEKVVYLPHHYQANDFPLFTDYCGGVSTELVFSENKRVNDEMVNLNCAGGKKFSEKRGSKVCLALMILSLCVTSIPLINWSNKYFQFGCPYYRVCQIVCCGCWLLKARLGWKLKQFSQRGWSLWY